MEESREFLGKVAIVTGSSSGIGRAIAQALAKAGACVTITGRNEKGLEEVLQECQDAGLTKDQILCIQGDIADDSTCEKLVTETIAQFGKIDILVNNAGMAFSTSLEQISMEKYDRIFNVNCRSAVLMTKLAIPHLLKTKGNVINISSLAGTNAIAGMFHYCMTKAALDHFTRCAALEFADRGVRVNSIAPGSIKTPIFTRTDITEDVLKKLLTSITNVTPLKRIGLPEEVADLALFLASKKASFITGSSFTVDGGLQYATAKLTPEVLDVKIGSKNIDSVTLKMCFQDYASLRYDETKGCKYEEYDVQPKPTIISNQTFVLTVYNERTGVVVFEKAFPTYEYYGWWGDLTWHLQRISPGRIVSVKVTPIGNIGIRNASAVLTSLGSFFVEHQDFRSQFVSLFVKGGKTFYESLAIKQSALLGNLELYLNKKIGKHEKLKIRNRKFCEKNDVIGDFCSNPDIMAFWRKRRKSIWPMFLNVPIIITAGKRYYYLYNTLYTLFSSPGIVSNMVHVILGDNNNSTIELLNILNINYTQSFITASKNEHLFNFYHKVYEFAAVNFPTSEYVIFLDEDVEISPDFFSYMSQTIHLLKKDPTLYCVNSQAGNLNTRHNISPSRIMRGSIQVCWGYAVTMDFVHKALEAWEHPTGTTAIYDFWLYTEVRGDRECIYPEVSRSKHFGMGVNVIPDVYEKYFYPTKLQREAFVKLSNVDQMHDEAWREQVKINLTKAQLIKENPCENLFYKKLENKTGHFVYLYYEEEVFHFPSVEFAVTATCLKYWSLSTQSTYRGIYFLHPFEDVYLYLVAFPASAFSYLFKKKEIPSVDDFELAFQDAYDAMMTSSSGKPEYFSLSNTTKILLHLFAGD